MTCGAAHDVWSAARRCRIGPQPVRLLACQERRLAIGRSRPKADREIVAKLRAVDRALGWVDTLGIRALTILARNKLPGELAGSSEQFAVVAVALTVSPSCSSGMTSLSEGDEFGGSARWKRRVSLQGGPAR